jgi:hypothetical protein
MSDKTRLLGGADEEFTALRQVIDGLTDEAMLRVWLDSGSVREILIHISGGAPRRGSALVVRRERRRTLRNCAQTQERCLCRARRLLA